MAASHPLFPSHGVRIQNCTSSPPSHTHTQALWEKCKTQKHTKIRITQTIGQLFFIIGHFLHLVAEEGTASCTIAAGDTMGHVHNVVLFYGQCLL